MMNNKIGKFICELRKEKGLTQKELGNRLFVTDKAVSKWERGLSFPDVSILEKLAKELDVEVSEILQGQKGNKEKDIEKMVNQKVDVIKKEIEVKKSQKIKIYFTGIFIILFICLVIFLSVNNYHKYHPDVINIGENNYKIKNYAVERKGLNVFKEIIQKTKNSTNKYNISYLKIKVNKKGILENFTMSVNFFDQTEKYVGRGGFTFQDKKLEYTYTSKESERTLLVEEYLENNNIDYMSEQIKKIPLKKQLKMTTLKNYFLVIEPSLALDDNKPIFDAQNNQSIKVLSKDDYNKFLGGTSKKGNYFAIRLYDGSSLISEEQYLYVFDFLDQNNIVNTSYMMDVDYFINNGTLKFTRDYGSTWIETDITKEELTETLNFYRDNALRTNSWFLSQDESLPIAYFYGEDATLKISNDNGKTWSEHKFKDDFVSYGKDITQRVVGFTSPNFGYVALGTDWTMGSGEFKKLYFTHDGGKTWQEGEIPLNNSSHILLDLCMYDEKVGVIILRDTLNSNFPLIYSTTSGGKAWNEVRYQDSNLPDEITYLNEVDSITKDGNSYFIKLGQGSTGTLKAIFRASDMIGWLFLNTTRENIHTVG